MVALLLKILKSQTLPVLKDVRGICLTCENLHFPMTLEKKKMEKNLIVGWRFENVIPRQVTFITSQWP